MQSTCLDSYEAVRDHLDLIVGHEDRCRHNVFFVLCDDAGQPVAHAAVDELPPDPPAEECTLAVEPFATALGQECPSGRLLVAPTRPGSPAITDVDRRWFDATHATCRRLSVAVHGVYVVTPHDTTQVHLDDVT